MKVILLINETAGSKPAFKGLEPYARKPARTVLRGRGDR